jgi:hypothetical protein
MNITVKKGSSIWKLDTNWGESGVSSNFCQLFWSVLWCFVVVTVAVILFSSYLGFLIATIAASISVGFIIWSPPLAIFAGLVAFIAIIALIAFTHVLASDAMDENPTGALSNSVNAYAAWKNKYCPQVKEI